MAGGREGRRREGDGRMVVVEGGRKETCGRVEMQARVSRKLGESRQGWIVYSVLWQCWRLALLGECTCKRG